MLGFISEMRGEVADADCLHREALTEARRLADGRALALCLDGLAGVALVEKDPRRAATCSARQPTSATCQASLPTRSLQWRARSGC
jgi:hypothetical protein